MLKPTHFTKLRSTVKAGLDLDLGPCTAFVGGNQSGKTSSMDTIRLALTGKHPIGPNPSDLVELMPEGGTGMVAELRNDTGEVRWKLDAPGGKAKRPLPPEYIGTFQGINPDLLVMENIGELLRYGKDKMREALMSRFGTVSEVETPLGLSSKQGVLWDASKAATASEPDASAQLAAMAKWFRSGALKKNKGATALDTAIERDKETLRSMTASPELLPDFERKLARRKAWDNAAATRLQMEELRQKIADETAATTALKPGDDPEPYKAALDEAGKVSNKAASRLHTAEQLVAMIAKVAGDCCPMCGTQGVDLAATLEVAKQAVKDRAQEITNASADIEKWQGILDKLSASSKEAELQLQGIEKLKAKLSGLEEALTDVPDTEPPKTVDQLQAEIDAIKHAAGIKTKLIADSEEMHLLREEADACKVLERESAKILKELLKDVQDVAESTVNKYMPQACRARLIISDKAVEWRVVGRDGRSHKRGGMCGVEWGSLLVAMACAWTEDSPLRVVLLDDVDLGVFSPKNLNAILGQLHAAQERGNITQVFVAWNRPQDIPADWHTINLGE